jgi:hypothetical protein
MEKIVSTKHTASIANLDEDYRRIGISRDTILAREDGARTDGRRGTYEWWYFDAHLDNGAKLVVIFMTKDLSTPGKPLAPMIRLNLDLPDGTSKSFIRTYGSDTYSAATEHADVRIAGNRLSGDLSHYRIEAQIEDVKVSVTLDSTIRPWRPETGYLVFGEKRDQEFSWLPAVPEGSVAGFYEVGGVRTDVTGVGYHDHNWGNVGMTEIINDWYWARGQAGPYSVIASYIISHEKYGYEEIPIFMLARDGEIVADRAEYVTFRADDAYIDPKTRKPIANVTKYTYDDGAEKYVVTFTKHRDLVAATFVEQMDGWRKLAAQLIRFDGAYLRFVGDLTVERWSGGELVETYSDEAIWEVMYFGHPRKDSKAPVQAGRARAVTTT